MDCKQGKDMANSLTHILYFTEAWPLIYPSSNSSDVQFSVCKICKIILPSLFYPSCHTRYVGTKKLLTTILESVRVRVILITPDLQ